MNKEINKELFFKSCLKKDTTKKTNSNYEQYLIERSDSDDDLHVQSFRNYKEYLENNKNLKPKVSVIKMKPLYYETQKEETKLKKIFCAICITCLSAIQYSKEKINNFYN